MNIFGSLYFYECKKILGRRLVRISFALCILLLVISSCINLFRSHDYGELRNDITYARALDGRKIDLQLLEETVNAYRKVPLTEGVHYSETAEYRTYARPYSEIFNFIIGSTNLTSPEIILSWQPDEDELYAGREQWLAESWRAFKLSDYEIRFWQEQESKIEKPIVFNAYSGYDILLNNYYTVGILVIMFLSVSLSNVFSEERSREMDQLILSSKMGRTRLYQAKIIAGISIGTGAALIFLIVICMLTFGLYGADGFQAAFQLYYRSNSYPITCGQALFIACGIMLAVSVTVSVIIMLLSELFKSGVTPLAVSLGLLVASIAVTVPEQYRVLAQLWNWSPWCFMSIGNIFGKYTLSLFGMRFVPCQIVPVIYLLLCIAAVISGKLIYKRRRNC